MLLFVFLFLLLDHTMDKHIVFGFQYLDITGDAVSVYELRRQHGDRT